MTTKTVSRKAAPSAASKSHAIKLLTADHAKVHGRFKNYSALCESGADGEQRQPLAEQICLLLTVHASVEEEIFYPEAREAEVDDELLNKAEAEHAWVKDLNPRFAAWSPMTTFTTPRSRC